jgi:hypothetical protein
MSDPAAVHDALTAMIAHGAPMRITRGEKKK